MLILLSLRALVAFAYILNVSVLGIDWSTENFPMQAAGRNPYNASYVLPFDLDAEFDERVDLNLVPPLHLSHLQDLGYSDELLREAGVVSDFAFTSPFQLLSPRGVEKLQRIVMALKQHSVRSPALIFAFFLKHCRRFPANAFRR